MTIQIRTPEEPTEIDADAFLPTEFGNFRIRVTVDEDGSEHCLVYAGDLQSVDAPLIRIHSECLTGDAFSSMKCDCGPQLQASLKQIQEEAAKQFSGKKLRQRSSQPIKTAQTAIYLLRQTETETD